LRRCPPSPEQMCHGYCAQQTVQPDQCSMKPRAVSKCLAWRMPVNALAGWAMGSSVQWTWIRFVASQETMYQAAQEELKLHTVSMYVQTRNQHVSFSLSAHSCHYVSHLSVQALMLFIVSIH
jgi:hypothetical protein